MLLVSLNEGADSIGINDIDMYGNDVGCMKFGRVIGGIPLFC